MVRGNVLYCASLQPRECSSAYVMASLGPSASLTHEGPCGAAAHFPGSPPGPTRASSRPSSDWTGSKGCQYLLVTTFCLGQLHFGFSLTWGIGFVGRGGSSLLPFTSTIQTVSVHTQTLYPRSTFLQPALDIQEVTQCNLSILIQVMLFSFFFFLGGKSLAPFYTTLIRGKSIDFL